MTILKIKTFFKSLFFHIWAGLPKSSKQQILERFEICSVGCEMYDSAGGTCLMCGCNVNTKKVFLNKLAWADQECPLGKWQKINNAN
jgi:hypothetical protein